MEINGRSTRGVASDVQRRLSLRARLLLRPEHARRRLGGDARTLRDAARRRGHPLGREFRARRVHRRAQLVAHVSRRRRPRERPSAASACSAWTGSWQNGAYRIKQSSAAAPWDADVARRRSHEPGVDVKEGDYVLAVNGVPLDRRRIRGRAFEGLADNTVLLTVNGCRRSTGARQVAVKCLRAKSSCGSVSGSKQRRAKVEKATGGKVGYVYVQSTGVDAQNELDAPVHGAVDEGRPRHRRAVQQRRSDSRSLHRAAEPADSELLGRARRRAAAMAAGGAPRADGDADQRLERIGRRRVPVLFPRGEARAADRHAHVGRPHRHQRIARPGRRRRRDGADLPHATTRRATGSPKGTASSRTFPSTRTRRSWRRGTTRSWSARFRKCSSGWRSCRPRRSGRRRRSDRPLRG